MSESSLTYTIACTLSLSMTCFIAIRNYKVKCMCSEITSEVCMYSVTQVKMQVLDVCIMQPSRCMP